MDGHGRPAVDKARPVIGVTSSTRGGRSLWLANRLALWRAGARAVRLTARGGPPPTGEGPDGQGLDGLLVGGGDDIAATLYGATVEPTVKVDPDRDALELAVLDWARQCGRPVLGICRGAQMINVHRGGTLHTDIHQVFVEAPRLRTVLPRKRVRIVPGTALAAILRQETCRVNALHHQSVARLGAGLRVAACDDAGIIQAVEGERGPFCVGVQWHPELLVADRDQQRLFRALVRAACEVRKGAPGA